MPHPQQISYRTAFPREDGRPHITDVYSPPIPSTTKPAEPILKKYPVTWLSSLLTAICKIHSLKNHADLAWLEASYLIPNTSNLLFEIRPSDFEEWLDRTQVLMDDVDAYCFNNRCHFKSAYALKRIKWDLEYTIESPPDSSFPARLPELPTRDGVECVNNISLYDLKGKRPPLSVDHLDFEDEFNKLEMPRISKDELGGVGAFWHDIRLGQKTKWAIFVCWKISCPEQSKGVTWSNYLAMHETIDKELVDGFKKDERIMKKIREHAETD